MKKNFRVENLDCANCAMKMERAISQIEGVTSAKVFFLTGKLTIEADDAKFDEIVAMATKVARKVEPDVKITAM